MSANTLRVLWFGSYARGPGYPRSEILIEGLRALGHEVTEVHAPLFEGAADRVAVARRGTFRTVLRQARAAARLAAGWFRAGEHDVAVVGAGGLLDAPLLRFLQNVDRRPIVLDAFVPLYDTAVRDRRLVDEGSLRARALRRMEGLGGRLADLVLADTAAHAELLAADMGVPREKLAVVEVAQRDGGPPRPLPDRPGGDLRVLLFATYAPLHGVETVIRAAGLLRDEGIHLTIVGTGQEAPKLLGEAEDVPWLEVIPQFLPEAEIRARLAACHVGLGIFGDTPKAARVVPLKAALVLSCGRALVTRSGPAAAAALDGAARLVPPADPEALAAALRGLRDDPAALAALASAGRRRYVERFTPEAAARSLLDGLGRAGLTP